MKRTSGILTLILALAVIVGALVCVNVFAADNKPVISMANVSYGEDIRIAFTVDNAEGGEYGIAEVKGDEENGYTVVYANYDKWTDGAVEYYLTPGIAAKDINTPIKYAVVEKTENGSEIVSDVVEYSIADYANARLEAEGTTEAQKNLYNKLLEYGKAASTVLEKNEPVTE